MTLPRASCKGPAIEAPDGVRVMVRLSPRAKSDRLVGVSDAAEGGRRVKASVTAPAQDGRANEALLQLLAKAWRRPRRDLSIVAGATSRNKIVRVAGASPKEIAKLLSEIAVLPSA